MSSDKVVVQRRLSIDLPAGQSCFLWGPRKIGKTTLLHQAFGKSLRYDLLKSELFLRLSKEPHRLREELDFQQASQSEMGPVIIDEIQKIPALLDEIHWLIENRSMSFILCGSSARTLKRVHANMLGGRAWRFELFPLTTDELGDEFDLLRALNRGLIPSHYLSDHFRRHLRAYLQDYLREEIQLEGLVRNLPAFARFLDAVPFNHGEMLNYSNIARDCAVDGKTVAEYYQILVDTLIGRLVFPYAKKKNRQIISATPKFYLFDVGLAGYLASRTVASLSGDEFGPAFEHFIFMELTAYRGYQEKDFTLNYWRTKEGHEVDFVLDQGRIAIEVKSARQVGSSHLKGLRVFQEDYRPKRAILVCQEPVPRRLDSGIEIMPWRYFLKSLWAGEIC